MAPRAKPTPNDERVRKVGDRTEAITIELTAEEVEAEKTAVLDLLGRRDNLVASRQSLASEYKAKIEAVDLAIVTARQVATTQKRQTEIDVEEWLTRSREVIRVRPDTGEVIGRRPARTEELQEVLFNASSRSTDDRADRSDRGDREIPFPTPDDAFGE